MEQINFNIKSIPFEAFKGNDCHYNPDTDVSAVVPTDVIDIADAFVNGIIPENVIAPDSDYDNSDTPDKVWKRPSNEFEAIHMAESIKQYLSSAKSEAEAGNNQ